MSTLIIPIGIPGSGKSTFIRKTSEVNNYVVVSPDEIREELTGDINNQQCNNKAWDVARERIVDFLEMRLTCILDATNTSQKYRFKFLDYVVSKVPDLFIEYWIFTETPEICKQRIKEDIKNNVNRSNVPDSVVDRMQDQYMYSMLYIDEDQKMYPNLLIKFY